MTPFEIIPYLLAVCRDVEDVKGVLASYTVRDLDFDEDTKNEPMHFHVSGRGGDIVLEPRGGELLVYENKVHVLTNAPCFEDQILCLDKTLESGALHTGTCCGEGSCARVIPADYSSPSRFVRAAWLCRFAEGYAESGEDIYDLMRCVAPPKGAVVGKGGRLHYTRYTAIMDTEKLCYSVRRGSAKYTLTLTEALAGGVGLYTSPFK